MEIAEAVGERSFRTSIPLAALDEIRRGHMHMTYRGIPCLKGPFDLALYLLLIQKLKPASMIEIGTKYGGSALWFADMLAGNGAADPMVVSVDIDSMATFTDPRIRFLQGDASDLGSTLASSLIDALPRPLFVVEDSSHLFPDALAVLEFFRPLLRPGEYIVVEDGVLSEFTGATFERFEDGPNRAVKAFLEAHPGEFSIDTELCDFFGYNATFSPNGWLRREAGALSGPTSSARLGRLALAGKGLANRRPFRRGKAPG